MGKVLQVQVMIFSVGPQIAQETKFKIDKWGCIKLKIFYTAKKTTNRIKTQLMEWKKRSSNPASDGGLMSRTYEGLKNITKSPIKNK